MHRASDSWRRTSNKSSHSWRRVFQGSKVCWWKSLFWFGTRKQCHVYWLYANSLIFSDFVHVFSMETDFPQSFVPCFESLQLSGAQQVLHRKKAFALDKRRFGTSGCDGCDLFPVVTMPQCIFWRQKRWFLSVQYQNWMEIVKECEGMWRKPRIWRSRRNATLTKFGWYSILSCGMLRMWIKLLKICLNIISDGKFYPYPSTDDRWNSQQIEPSQGDVSSLKLTGTSGRVQETQGFSRFLMACTSQICWGGSTFISP
jgi:hypothetical protein